MMPSYDQHIHAYEQLSLSTAGVILGLILVIGHAYALLKPEGARHMLRQLPHATLLGQVTLGVATLWFMLLMLDASWNPLTIDLFSFESLRSILLIAAPIVWFVLSTMVKENLFARALGFLILIAISVPLTAAFLKEPITRLLIPIWCYPVLTVAMFWVAKPYLFRDMVDWICERPTLLRLGAAAGTLYGIVMIACAILFW